MEKVEQPNGVVVSAKCSRCNSLDTVEVEQGTLNRFELRQGLVQDLFPHLDEAEREVLLGWRNGWYLCSSCWDEAWKESEAKAERGDA
tara:strand:+ start:2127 stop:2390 length:264 start_codon:yes stop_codon:yes gene_type:complete